MRKFLILLALATALPAHAGVVFQVRGTQLNAYYSTAGNGWRSKRDNGASLPALKTEAHSSVFGNSVINVDGTNKTRTIIWPGFSNWSQQPAMAVLVRIVPNFTGFPPDNQNIFFAGDPQNAEWGGFWIRWNSDGTLSFLGQGEYGATLIHGTTVATVSGVAGQARDIMMSWDGSTITAGVKIGVDGVQVETIGAVEGWAAYATDRSRSPITQISVGFGPGSSGVSNFGINEIVVFDNAQSVATGVRTGFWTTTASEFDGTYSTDPGVANVISTAGSYTINGVAKSPTYVAASTTNVKHGITFGAASALTGTYRGADLFSDPGVANVLEATTYLYDGATLTGTLRSVSNSFCSATLSASLTPGTTRLYVTRGDAASLVLYAQDGAGAALDLTGATFTTYLAGQKGATVTLGNSKHTADPDQVANKGKFTLAMTTSDSLALGVGTEKEILVKVVQGSSTIYFHGRKLLTVLPNGPVK